MAVTAEQVQQVAGLIQGAFESANDPNVQKHVNEVFQTNAASPEFNLCLLEVATSAQVGNDITRAQAAYRLKENTRHKFEEAVKPHLATIKDKILVGLHAPNDHIRGALASCISEIAKTGSWPDLVPILWPQLCASSDLGFRAGVLVCIRDVCEDCADQLELKDSAAGKSQAEILIPELIKLVMNTQSLNEVLQGVKALFHLLNHESFEEVSPIDNTFQALLGEMLGALSKAITLGHAANPTNEMEADVVKTSLHCLRLLCYYYQQLKESGALSSILKLIYDATEAKHKDIALAGCEFWLHATTKDMVPDLIQMDLLPALATQLLNKMVFSDEELYEIQDEEESENVLPKSVTRKGRKKNDDGDERPVEQWTLRRCASYTLDYIAATAQAVLITPPGKDKDWLLMQEILPRLQSNDWKIKESAVLALGAILSPNAQGSNGYGFIEPHLPQLFPPLVSLLENPKEHFLVRTITSWMLSLVVEWMFKTSPDHVSRFFSAVLNAMNAGQRKTQEAAVSAFLTLLEKALYDPNAVLISNEAYYNAILSHIHQFLTPGHCTMLNLSILLECVTPFLLAFGDRVVDAEGHQKMLAPLVELQLLRCKLDDDRLFPRLIHTVARCAEILGAAFAKYVPKVFEFMLNIIGKHFEVEMRRAQNVPDKELPDIAGNAKLCVDTIGVFVQAMSTTPETAAQMNQLLTALKYPGTEYTFLDLIVMPLANDPGAEANQEFATASMWFIGEHLSTYPAQLARAMASPQLFSRHLLPLLEGDTEICNSTAWFMGDIALGLEAHVPQNELQQIIGLMANGLIPILIRDEWDAYLLRSAAISVGKLAYVQPVLLAGQLNSFYPPLLKHLATCTYEEGFQAYDVERAFIGMSRMLEANFNVLESKENIELLARSLQAFSNLQHHPEVMERMAGVVHALKQKLGPHFQQMLTVITFPPCLLAKVM